MSGFSLYPTKDYSVDFAHAGIGSFQWFFPPHVGEVTLAPEGGEIKEAFDSLVKQAMHILLQTSYTALCHFAHRDSNAHLVTGTAGHSILQQMQLTSDKALVCCNTFTFPPQMQIKKCSAAVELKTNNDALWFFVTSPEVLGTFEWEMPTDSLKRAGKVKPEWRMHWMQMVGRSFPSCMNAVVQSLLAKNPLASIGLVSALFWNLERDLRT